MFKQLLGMAQSYENAINFSYFKTITARRQDYMKDYMRNRYHEKRQQLIQELGGKCNMCGTKSGPWHIDHIDKTKKTMRASDIHSINDKDVKKEKKNFQLLCVKCHKEKTHDAWDYSTNKPKHGTYWMARRYGCKCPACQKAYKETLKKWRDKKEKKSLLEQIQLIITAESSRTWDLKHLLGPKDFDTDIEPYKPIKGLNIQQQRSVAYALEETGAKAIPRGSHGSPVLGKGAYGVVIDVVYNGHQAAMKITKDEMDAENYRALQNLYNSLPNFIKRHVPQVYLTKEITDPEGEFDCYVTIMEQLQPLPSGIKLQGWGYEENSNNVRDITNNIINNTINNIDSALYEIIDDFAQDKYLTSIIFDELNKCDKFQFIKNKENYKVLNFASDNLLSNQYKIMNFVYNHIQKAMEHVVKKIVESLNETDENYEYIYENMQSIYVFIDDIAEHLTNELGLNREFLDSDFTDVHIEDPIETFKDPRLAKLYVALNWLRKNKGIEIQDMHTGNVLYRPSTDDLVVSDVGLWIF